MSVQHILFRHIVWSRLNTPELLHCRSTIKHLSSQNREILTHMKYEHIFGTIGQQLTATILFEEIINIREELTLSSEADRGSNTGPPADILM